MGARQRGTATSDQQYAERLHLFFDEFRGTLALARELAGCREHGIDIITLVCARLDGLAMAHAGSFGPNKKNFSDFVTTFGGHERFMGAVSAGDLFGELIHQDWYAEWTLPQAGRVQHWHRGDTDFLELIARLDELPLTVPAVRQLVRRLAEALQASYRVIPGQSHGKPENDSPRKILEVLCDGLDARGTRHLLDQFKAAAPEWLREFRLNTLLYKDYRSASIHGLDISIDWPECYTRKTVYWTEQVRHFSRSHLGVTFGALFLCDLLDNCINGYTNWATGRGKLPPDMYFAVFGWDSLEHLDRLDDASLLQARRARIQLRP